MPAHYHSLNREELVASLLRGFAAHRREPGLPDDHWLPQDVYDEDRWGKNDLYLYIITDGSVGGPRGARRPDQSDAVLSSCNVCEPKAPTDLAHERQAALAHLSGVLSDERSEDSRAGPTPTAGQQDSSAGPTPTAGQLAFRRLLHDLGLGHLQQTLRDEAFADVAGQAAASRTAFLAGLKVKGVDKLAERQKLANGVARAAREGGVPPA